MRRMEHRPASMLGLIALVMVTAACSSPAPTPGPHDLVSKRYHVELTVPKGWDKVDAQAAWDGKDLPDEPPQTSPIFASVASGNGERKFAVTAAPVAKGMRLAAWQAFVGSIGAPGCVPGSVKKTTLGGEPALTWTENCGDLHPTPIVALHGGRGYLAIAELNPPDPRIRASILRSFHFTG